MNILHTVLYTLPFVTLMYDSFLKNLNTLNLLTLYT